MKKLLFIGVLACFSFGSQAQIKDSVSYAYGFLLGTDILKSLQSSALELDKEEFLAAISAAILNDKALIDKETASKIMDNFVKQMRAKELAKDSIAAKQAKEEEDAWFAAHVDKNPKVLKTASGLRYEVLKKGKGKTASSTSQVTVHYTGTLIDGHVFDSSVERGEPATFSVGGVIPGWVEALQLMSTGSKFKLYIPFHLAYSNRGAGRDIPPYSTLIFEVEMIKITD